LSLVATMSEREQGQRPQEDAILGDILSASADRTPVIRPEKRAQMLSALLAENARLAETRAKQPASTREVLLPAPVTVPGVMQRAQQRVDRFTRDATNLLAAILRGYALPRVVTGFAMMALLASGLFSYYIFGGKQTSAIASISGSARISESRSGLFGMRWHVPDLITTYQTRPVFEGDIVQAASQLTITYPSGVQTVVAQDSQIVMAARDRLRIVNGRILNAANLSAQPGTISASTFVIESPQATYVMTDAVTEIVVRDDGAVTQTTLDGSVTAKSERDQAIVGVGEQSVVDKLDAIDVIVQAPVVMTETTASGAISFTAQTVISGSLIAIDKATGAELATFSTDEEGVVSGELTRVDTTTDISWRVKTTDNRVSVTAPGVSVAPTAERPTNAVTSMPLPTTVTSNPNINEVPKLRLPAISPVQATSSRGALVSFGATVIDIDGREFPAVCDRPSPSIFQIGASVVTCSGTSSNGRSVSGIFKVTVEDREKPSLALPSTINLEASNANGAVLLFNASAQDNISGKLTPSCSIQAGSVVPLGATTVSCSASDEFGNKSVGSFNVIVVDSTKPTVKTPGDIFVGAKDGSGAPVDFAVSALDRVDSAPDISCSVGNGAIFPIGVTRVTCTATDDAGNSDSDSFQVTVVDGDKPLLSLPANLVVEASGPGGANVAFLVSGEDSVDRALPVSCIPASGSTFELGSTTVTCSARDRAGNSSSGSFTVNVQDSTKPRLTLPSLSIVGATGAKGATVSFSAGAEDTVDGKVGVSCTPASGSMFALGSTSVTCSASDSRGNAGSASFIVQVKDLTAPTLNLPTTINNIEASSARGAAVSFQASASDAVDGTLIASCSQASGSTFGLGTSTVSCSASDKAGNSASGSFTVRVVDTRGPTISTSGDLSISASGPRTAASWSASARDAVDGPVAVSCSPRSGSGFPVGVSTVTCSASDKAGNGARESFKITVNDTTAPDISTPGDIILEATGPGGAAATFAAEARDAVDGLLSITCSASSGTTFGLGATPVTCSARDAAGNPASKSFVVRVVDTTAPRITTPGGITRDSLSASGISIGFDVFATDLVDTNVSVSCAPASGSIFSIGISRVTCTARDASGNSSTAGFDVTVNYIPPTATPEPPTATPEPPTATPDPPTATPEPPTATPEPPTATPDPPTVTPQPPTVTPIPPTETPIGGLLETGTPQPAPNSTGTPAAPAAGAGDAPETP
jgi:hypothetical protein